jgi:hypothetical protein
MEEAFFPHLYEPINHTEPLSKTERHRHLAHFYDFQHVQMPSPTLQAILFFWYFPPPQKRGRGGVGARSSSSENTQPPQQQQRAQGETR